MTSSPNERSSGPDEARGRCIGSRTGSPPRTPTDRQLQILATYATTCSVAATAQELTLANSTVKNTLSKVYRGLCSHGAIEAFRAIGWLRVPDLAPLPAGARDTPLTGATRMVALYATTGSVADAATRAGLPADVVRRRLISSYRVLGVSSELLALRRLGWLRVRHPVVRQRRHDRPQVRGPAEMRVSNADLVASDRLDHRQSPATGAEARPREGA